jgi:hypothetical protein
VFRAGQNPDSFDLAFVGFHLIPVPFRHDCVVQNLDQFLLGVHASTILSFFVSDSFFISASGQPFPSSSSYLSALFSIVVAKANSIIFSAISLCFAHSVGLSLVSKGISAALGKT